MQLFQLPDISKYGISNPMGLVSTGSNHRNLLDCNAVLDNYIINNCVMNWEEKKERLYYSISILHEIIN